MNVNMDDVFNQFFGGGQRRPQGPRPGAHVNVNIQLEFLEAVNGIEREIRYMGKVSTPPPHPPLCSVWHSLAG